MACLYRLQREGASKSSKISAAWRSFDDEDFFPVSPDNKKTILIVDSQPTGAVALRKQLDFAGFNTQVAHTGTGAINKIAEYLPDLVLLEVNLSDGDPLEVISFIRNESKNCLIPVFAMSVFPHMKDKFLRGGCSDFFQKPIKILDIVARIRKAVR
jgi:DNA-binding response OmpR family regulator